MVDAIDIAIRKYKESNERVIAAAQKRYTRYKKLADKAKTPAQKKSAERNMEVVIFTLQDQQERFKKTMAKLKK
ncbi:hypothetical protein [Bradyrhizobium canariense]|uniref:Uncharacterized protein n=1 Tax=Bradyrhizobium canariense TaxID=255045 RepID=A0A1X3FQ22_9BRAD|nr:hypothetical protein [Bradyrhizobium canariense]OSI68604.1 hypothetical protein BSZ22_20780 [Bradyrhizobium canariense]OSI78052.1 hypothetical protein BSZ23_19780 [Bradyrhizobium canariense]OSI89282.1 hypothetical protein BSZ25_21250 [Bradyrhizobium canariense]OSI93111.1 hypothetical protein BSZ24_13370 [Bradyrhizobium canariense]OSJ03081.1 hypothetical protein BSZ16_16675 [Bradyrhizobium canariense]